jgi:hypothetical protein
MNMRKTLYRLTVALITFTIGVIGTFYLHQSGNVSRIIEVAKPSTPKPIIKKPSIICNDELLKQISNELMSDKYFVDWLAFENLNSFDCSKNFAVAQVDLNSDGKPEFAVRGFNNYMCGASGNCSFWIYRKAENGYEKILEGVMQTYNFRCTLHNDYCDIVTYTHDSAFDSSILVYRFDGDKYKIIECGERSYSYLDKQGRFHERKRPLVTFGKCYE